MTLAFDPSDDLLRVADGLETVTLRRRGSSPGGPGERIARALCRSVTTREAAASDGRYTTSDVVWRLPAADLPQPPRPGDVIAGGDRRQWTVLETQRAGLNANWRCASRSLALVYGLDDAVSILQATYAKGPGAQPNRPGFPGEPAFARVSSRCSRSRKTATSRGKRRPSFSSSSRKSWPWTRRIALRARTARFTRSLPSAAPSGSASCRPSRWN